MTRILFIGDIVGRPGRRVVIEHLARVRKLYDIDIVIANAENSAGGVGINANIASKLQRAGLDGITLGDHVWDQVGFDREIQGLSFVCRPANLSVHAPGRSSLVVKQAGFRLGVVTVLGRVFMRQQFDCPFAEVDRQIAILQPQVDALFVEVHAEATSEKVALGWYLDGRVALVAGTHTHVPTADARVLPKGTAYITDVGMTGPYASVLGSEKETVINKFCDGIPRRFTVATGDVRLCGCIADISAGGKAQTIQRLELTEEELQAEA